MILESLLLNNFRNYNSSSFNFNSKLNFIFGDNGNGKTNVLEAISMMCYTKSFLQSSESDCVQYGMQEFDITGGFVNNAGIKSRIRYTYSMETGNKQITLNDEPVGRLSYFFGKIPLVVLSPADIKLTYGTPGDKRRNFDILISQISRTYFDDLKRYNRILKQKNSLLKDNLIREKYSRNEMTGMMDAWDKELCETGVKIILKRVLFVKEFQKYITIHFKDIAGAGYIPLLDYESEVLNDTKEDSIEESLLRQNFSKLLAEKRKLELSRGISLTGPQRDNYSFKMKKNGSTFELKNFASQGEHKTFIVAIKLSEYIYLSDKLDSDMTGDPILLLDDLFSELDSSRTERISSILPNFGQIFLTTTEYSYMSLLNKYFKNNYISSFNIINGTSRVANQV
jgi:DNA replication and repair protein RecF